MDCAALCDRVGIDPEHHRLAIVGNLSTDIPQRRQDILFG